MRAVNVEVASSPFKVARATLTLSSSLQCQGFYAWIESSLGWVKTYRLILDL